MICPAALRCGVSAHRPRLAGLAAAAAPRLTAAAAAAAWPASRRAMIWERLGRTWRGLGRPIVAALAAQDDQRAIAEGAAGVARRGAGAAERYGAQVAAVDVEAARLKEMLTYPPEWGPSEWGEAGRERLLGVRWWRVFSGGGWWDGRGGASPRNDQLSPCLPPGHVLPSLQCPRTSPQSCSAVVVMQGPSLSSPTTTSWCRGWRSSGGSWASTRASGESPLRHRPTGEEACCTCCCQGVGGS